MASPHRYWAITIAPHSGPTSVGGGTVVINDTASIGDGSATHRISLSGADAGNYALAGSSASTTGRITPRPLGVTGLTEWQLSAVAVARPVGGQSLCAIPIAMCSAAAAGTPNLGFTPGTWYDGRMGAGGGLQGNYGWIRFEGQGGKTLAEILAGPGMCNIGGNLVDAEPGVSGGVAQAWNTRFGLYSGSWNDIDNYPPDRTGYAYTPSRVTSKGVTIPGKIAKMGSFSTRKVVMFL